MLQASTNTRVKFITAIILGAIALLSSLFISNQNAANERLQTQKNVLQFLTLANQIQSQVMEFQQLRASKNPEANKSTLKQLTLSNQSLGEVAKLSFNSSSRLLESVVTVLITELGQYQNALTTLIAEQENFLPLQEKLQQQTESLESYLKQQNAVYLYSLFSDMQKQQLVFQIQQSPDFEKEFITLSEKMVTEIPQSSLNTEDHDAATQKVVKQRELFTQMAQQLLAITQMQTEMENQFSKLVPLTSDFVSQVERDNTINQSWSVELMFVLTLILIAFGVYFLFSTITHGFERKQKQLFSKAIPLSSQPITNPDQLDQLLENLLEKKTQTSQLIEQLLQALQTNSAANMDFSALHNITDDITGLAKSCENISHNFQDINSISSDSKLATENAQNNASEGQDVVSGMTQNVQNLTTHIAKATQQINDLATNSESIGTVVDMITSITEQTNLLALNAAIEAARAGEHGRGFAVVADEVRSLATKTASAAVDIKNQVADIQNAARTSAGMMEQSQQMVNTSVNEAQSTIQAFDTIASSINEIGDNNKRINKTAGESTELSEQISQQLRQFEQQLQTAVKALAQQTENSEMAQHSLSLCKTLSQTAR